MYLFRIHSKHNHQRKDLVFRSALVCGLLVHGRLRRRFTAGLLICPSLRSHAQPPHSLPGVGGAHGKRLSLTAGRTNRTFRFARRFKSTDLFSANSARRARGAPAKPGGVAPAVGALVPRSVIVRGRSPLGGCAGWVRAVRPSRFGIEPAGGRSPPKRRRRFFRYAQNFPPDYWFFITTGRRNTGSDGRKTRKPLFHLGLLAFIRNFGESCSAKAVGVVQRTILEVSGAIPCAVRVLSVRVVQRG